MPESQREWGQEVLTLAEAAAFLRVSEDALAALADRNHVPAQKIAGEWRFLKRALADWLRYGPSYKEYAGYLPPRLFEVLPSDELMALLGHRLFRAFCNVEGKPPKPGSKEAVAEHFGVWRDDPTAETMLADIYKRRRDEGEE